MGAPDILSWLAGRGLTVRPRPDGNLEVSPRRLLTDEARQLIREHKAELLTALADPLPDPVTEARRQQVLELLAENPTARYAVLTDTEADAEAVLLTLAIRGQTTCEFQIPREKWDGVLFLELLERHGLTVH